MLPTTVDRVPQHTPARYNRRIHSDTQLNIYESAAGGSQVIAERLAELDREWDIERLLEANAASLALTGVVLGATVDRRLLILPAAVTAFLLQHALQGWCPPVPLFRRLGFRTAGEINEERTALKLIRGDFDGVRNESQSRMPNVDRILAAVRR